MADLIQIEELRTYLVDQGIVQLPADTGDLPICYLQPCDGAPQVDTDTRRTTITLSQVDYVPRKPLEEWLEEVVIEVKVRSYQPPAGYLLHRQIRELLDGAQLVTVGDLLCEWIRLWRGTRPVDSDKNSITTASSYRIAARSKSLAGLPYAP